MKPLVSLIVFSRAPVWGRVKTRLATNIGPDLALEVHRRLLLRALYTARKSGAIVWLAHDGESDFEECNYADRSIRDSGETYGDRIDHAMVTSYQLSRADYTLIVPSDVPELSPSLLTSALAKLRTHESVVGPTVDLGVYLLGFRGRPHPVGHLFSRSSTFNNLLEFFDQRHLSTEVLEPARDVDTLQDLRRAVPGLDDRRSQVALGISDYIARAVAMHDEPYLHHQEGVGQTRRISGP